jgi:hypothetical protein
VSAPPSRAAAASPLVSITTRASSGTPPDAVRSESRDISRGPRASCAPSTRVRVRTASPAAFALASSASAANAGGRIGR